MENITLNEDGTVTVQTISEQQVALATYIEQAQRQIDDTDKEIAILQARKQAILDRLQQLLTPVDEEPLQEEPLQEEPLQEEVVVDSDTITNDEVVL